MSLKFFIFRLDLMKSKDLDQHISIENGNGELSVSGNIYRCSFNFSILCEIKQLFLFAVYINIEKVWVNMIEHNKRLVIYRKDLKEREKKYMMQRGINETKENREAC